MQITLKFRLKFGEFSKAIKEPVPNFTDIFSQFDYVLQLLYSFISIVRSYDFFRGI